MKSTRRCERRWHYEVVGQDQDNISAAAVHRRQPFRAGQSGKPGVAGGADRPPEVGRSLFHEDRLARRVGPRHDGRVNPRPPPELDQLHLPVAVDPFDRLHHTLQYPAPHASVQRLSCRPATTSGELRRHHAQQFLYPRPRSCAGRRVRPPPLECQHCSPPARAGRFDVRRLETGPEQHHRGGSSS